MTLSPHLAAAIAELRALGWVVTAPETTAVGLQWRRSDDHWTAGEFEVAPCAGWYLLLRDGWVCRQFGRLTDAFDAAEQLSAREKVM